MRKQLLLNTSSTANWQSNGYVWQDSHIPLLEKFLYGATTFSLDMK